MQEQDILDNLLLRLDSAVEDWKIVTYQEIKDWPKNVFPVLCQEGLLVETTPSNTFPCTECDDDHDEEIFTIESPEGSGRRIYIDCPTYGRVRVDPEELRQWRIVPEGLVKIVGKLLGLSEPHREFIPGRVWSLGIEKAAGGNREVMLLRGLGWEDGNSIQERVCSSTTSIPRITLLVHGTPNSLPCSLALSDVVRLECSGLLLDRVRLDLVITSWQAKPPLTDKGEPVFEHSENYRWIRWRGEEYSLSKRRAQVVEILHHAYKAGRPVLSWEQIKGQLIHHSERMSDLFKGSPVWGTVVIEDGQGLYRLDI